jgi:hypothetical protein
VAPVPEADLGERPLVGRLPGAKNDP